MKKAVHIITSFLFLFLIGVCAFKSQNISEIPVSEIVPVVEAEEEEIIEEIPRIDPERPMVALTFDDGPNKNTDRLLDVLEKYDVHASFFLVGENVGYYPKTVKRIHKLGCDIGNHSYNHLDFTKLNEKGIFSQIHRTDNKIKDAAGVKSSLVRPPYGAVNKLVLKEVDLPIILWTVDTMDWNTKNAKDITKEVLKTVEDGDIILMHDIYSSTVEAVELLIPKLIKKGYQIVSVSEMAQARGVKLEKGKKYFSFPLKE